MAFNLLNKERTEAFNCSAEFEKEFPQLQYYITTLRYLSDEFFSPDEMQVKKVKKAFLDSIDQYCVEELKKTGPLPDISR